MVIGGGHLATPYRDRNETVIDWAKLAISARTVWELFPAMRAATIVRAWAGIGRCMPDDIRWSGRVRRREASSTSSGFLAHGIQLGSGTGAMMAELVATGATNLPIDGTRHRSHTAWTCRRAASRSPGAGSARRRVPDVGIVAQPARSRWRR